MDDTNKKVENNEIDDFARALLEKKTEVKLYKDVEVEEKEESDTPEHREEIEKEMSSALDRLRQERGQKTIAQEEREYKMALEKKPSVDETLQEIIEEDFTTKTILMGQKHPKSRLKKRQAKKVEKKVEQKVIVEKEQKPKKKMFQRKKKIVKEPIEEEIQPTKKLKKAKKPKKEKKPVDPKRKLKWIGALIVLLCGVLLLCGYSYKVIYYDPAHAVTKKQEKLYDKFIPYADEWDMLSDTEKNELLGMEDDYDKLTDQQKLDINAYFKEQTGKKLSTIFKNLKDDIKNQETESDETYLTLVNFMNEWDSYEDYQKESIVNYKDAYKSLSDYLQKKVNDVSKEKTGKSFLTIIYEYEKAAEEEAKKQEEEQKSETDEQLSELQTALEDTQAQLEAYQTYGQELQKELIAARDDESEVSRIQSLITTNDQTIESYQTQVEEYQQQIEALQQ